MALLRASCLSASGGSTRAGIAAWVIVSCMVSARQSLALPEVLLSAGERPREPRFKFIQHPHFVTITSMSEMEPTQWPIDGVLDLHLFAPRDVKDLVPHYLAECRARGITTVRIIHGKGTGTMRETVWAILKRTPGIQSFQLAPVQAGGWGATIVELA